MQSTQLSLTHQVVHELGRQIMKGDYGVGDTLPSEAELGSQFGVSRTSKGRIH